ncbi:IclR family transcriptional regulator [Streptomyces sp. SAS_281]|uniref:IclR family transcriptional regulator n=1 Tax=Streptomyces sp. SAS_281 TaxID=3412744 RepID=UPI00403CE49C
MQVVIRALNVLRALAPKTRGATLQELHEELDIPVGSLHRVLATLTEQDFVTRSPANRRFFLGQEARRLADQNADRSALLFAPHPAISAAAEASGETVFLTELIGDRAVCVALSEGRHPLRLFVRIGQEMPLHAAASGRSLLSHLPERAVQDLVGKRPLTAFTADTPTTVEAVLEHLALVRARGYDVCDDELDRGVWAVAAPVFTSTGTTAASVTLAAAGGRMRDPLVRATAVQTVLTAARALSDGLGFTSEWRDAAAEPAGTPAAADRGPVPADEAAGGPPEEPAPTGTRTTRTATRSPR